MFHCKKITGRHRLRDPNRPAFLTHLRRGLGKNLLCGVFTIPHEFVALDGRRDTHIAGMFRAAA